jgi:hypothetical protein
VARIMAVQGLILQGDGGAVSGPWPSCRRHGQR